ncbi:Copper-transporting ATPase PAA2 [Stylosanthes scabra]|uniref:Copper-transporting ATPase PAA2 n=1 Tax=Stylosanthes scabra TaxID=79078 RepID=A0ABU6VAF1_9FABA|nr:Copper-transporting ATPase PAA2 [Stylosanthes scabra]
MSFSSVVVLVFAGAVLVVAVVVLIVAALVVQHHSTTTVLVSFHCLPFRSSSLTHWLTAIEQEEAEELRSKFTYFTESHISLTLVDNSLISTQSRLVITSSEGSPSTESVLSPNTICVEVPTDDIRVGVSVNPML